MNSSGNSFRILTASGDPVISLLLSHKALYLSHMQAHTHTHLYADAAIYTKHTSTPTTYSSVPKEGIMLQI